MMKEVKTYRMFKEGIAFEEEHVEDVRGFHQSIRWRSNRMPKWLDQLSVEWWDYHAVGQPDLGKSQNHPILTIFFKKEYPNLSSKEKAELIGKLRKLEGYNINNQDNENAALSQRLSFDISPKAEIHSLLDMLAIPMPIQAAILDNIKKMWTKNNPMADAETVGQVHVVGQASASIV